MNGLTTTHFYRYQTCSHLERLEQVLIRHELYFPTAAELNDPAEGRPRLTAAPARMTARFLVRMFARAHPEASLEDRAKQFRDAMQGICDLGEEWTRQELTRLLHEHSPETRVFSMSKRWNNMSMWAKYADNHQGYCLEFANTGMFTDAREVEYGDVIELDLTVPTAAKDAALLFFRKTTDWSNEEEVRIVGPTFAQPSVSFDPASLMRIMLGKNMKPEHRRQIRAWAAVRSPALLVTEVKYDNVEQILKLVPAATGNKLI